MYVFAGAQYGYAMSFYEDDYSASYRLGIKVDIHNKLVFLTRSSYINKLE